MPDRSKNYTSCLRGSPSREKSILLHDLTSTDGSKTRKKSVLELMQIELEAHSLDVSSMVLDRLSRMIPDNDASQEQLENLKMLLIQPILLSNKQLGGILQLEELHKQAFTNETVEARQYLFYIRSWSFSPSQLYSVSDMMQKNGLEFPQLDEWKFASLLAKSCDRSLTIRYIGATNSRKNVFRRFSDDLNNKPESSLFGSMLRFLKMTHLDVFNSAEIHLISDVSLEILGNQDHKGNRLNADDTESILIHLLGCRSLLNVQLGGNHIRYLANYGDEILFKSLATDYFEDFCNQCSEFPEGKWQSLVSSLDSIFTEISTPDCSATKPIIEVLGNQAKPFQYLGTTIMTFLGEELSLGHFNAGCSFLNGHAKSSRLVRNLVHRIASIEERSWSRLIGNLIDHSSRDIGKIFTFLNTFPIPKLTDKAKCLQFLKAYFECTRPVMVITFGKRAASAIISNLENINGKSRRAKLFLIPGAWKLGIHSYGTDQNEDVFIHIPLKHPASHQYGSRSAIELRHFYLTIQFAFFVASCAKEVIKESSITGSRNESRKYLCEEILVHMGRKLQTETGSMFRLNIEQAGKASEAGRMRDTRPSVNVFDHHEKSYRDWLECHSRPTGACDMVDRKYNVIPRKSSATYPPNHFIALFAVFEKNTNSIGVLDKRLIQRISNFGRAIGEAYSEERQKDLDRVWNQNRKELHLAIPHLHESRDFWMEQFRSLQPGQLYFLASFEPT